MHICSSFSFRWIYICALSTEMYCFIDLRYGIPPLICLILLFFQNPESTPWNQNGALETHHHAILAILLLLILAMTILFFLFTSIKLPLSVSTKPIRLHVGDFSCGVAILLVASFIFPPPLFWPVGYPLVICITPWYGLLLNPLKQLHCWLCHTLRAIPPLIIICIAQQHESLEPEHPRVEIEVLDIEGQPMQGQSCLEDDFVVVVGEHP